MTDMELSMPELKLTPPYNLNTFINDMDSDFWQQRGLIEVKKGEIKAAMDYFKQGLRLNPSKHKLIYSLAVCYSRLKMYQSAINWFSRGIDLHPRWVDGLCGIAITYFNMLDFERALKYISLAKDNNKGMQMKTTNPELSTEYIDFITATCLKMTMNHSDASKVYINLEVEFKKRLSADLRNLLWGLILVPLSDDRKVIADHFTNVKEYLEHLAEVKMPEMED